MSESCCAASTRATSSPASDSRVSVSIAALAEAAPSIPYLVA
jgi:hypothetical protein